MVRRILSDGGKFIYVVSEPDPAIVEWILGLAIQVTCIRGIPYSNLEENVMPLQLLPLFFGCRPPGVCERYEPEWQPMSLRHTQKHYLRGCTTGADRYDIIDRFAFDKKDKDVVISLDGQLEVLRMRLFGRGSPSASIPQSGTTW